MSITLEQIYRQCEEVGDCLEWRGYVAQGSPRVYDKEADKYHMVRRLVVEQERGHTIPKRIRCSPKCENSLCVLDAHIVLLSYSQLGRIVSKAGKYSTPAVKAKKTLCRRRRADLKLDMDKARAIRASELNSSKEAEKHGCSAALVRAIRCGRVWREDVSGASVFTYRPERKAA